MKFIDFFNRIYVLNLPERTDRLKYIKQEMTRIDMPFESDKVRLFPAIKPKNKEPFVKLGSKGCFLSTLKILKESREENLKNLLILQDDAQFLPTFQDHEASLVSQLREKDWDIVQFGYFPLPDNGASETFTNLVSEKVGALIPFSGQIIGAHCFAVNGKSLDKYIEFLEGLLSRPPGHPDGGPMPIDGSFNRFSLRSDVTRLIVIPSLVTQKSSRSDVSLSWYDNIRLLRPLLSMVRNLGVTRWLRHR